ncbi:AAEL010398-PA [Aedes aegypti]|uniref:AAEL010398-PA n=2 Tax=Aedes aegypti TaxID=7159 RepID=A0A1S4FQM1_AEDAE|nr:uncharacterized protein LOC5573304 [Aedes aegypti]EAT37633.1 AAEL010398-PA [Aedes aegypti]
MQLIGEAMLLIVLVRLTSDVAAASIDSGSSTSAPAELSSQRFLINNQWFSTQKPTVGSSSKGSTGQGWFRNTLSVYSRIQPRVGRDTEGVDPVKGRPSDGEQYAEEIVLNS